MEAKDLSVFTVGKRFMGEYMVEHVVPFFNGELAISKAFDESYFLQLIHLERTVTTIEFERVRRLYEELDHPLLIPFYDLFLEQNALVMVYPYQPLQLLPEVVSRSGVEEEQIVRWIKDLIDLEIYLRSQSIPMFYVKDPRNVGLNSQGELKILYSGVDEVTPYPLDLNWGSFVYSIMSGQFLESSLQKMPSKHTLSRPLARLVQKCFKAKSLMSMQAHFEQYLNRKESKGFLSGLFGGLKKEQPASEVKVQEPQPQTQPRETKIKPVKQELLLTEPKLDLQGLDEHLNQSSPQQSQPFDSQQNTPPEEAKAETSTEVLPPQTEAQTNQAQAEADFWNTAPPSQPIESIETPLVEQAETNNFTRKPFDNNQTITEEEWAVVENAYQSQQSVVDDDTKIFQPNNQTITQESDEDWLKELNITQEELDQLVSQHQATQEPLPAEWEQLDVNTYDQPSQEQVDANSASAEQDDLDLAEGPIIDWSQVNPQQTGSEASYEQQQPMEQQISQSFDEIERTLSVDHEEALSLNQEQSFQAPTEGPDASSLQNLDALLAEMQSLQQDIKRSTSSDEVTEEPVVNMINELESMPNPDELAKIAEQFGQIFQEIDRYLDDHGPHHVVSATVSEDLEKEIQTTYEQASATVTLQEETRPQEEARPVEQIHTVEQTSVKETKPVEPTLSHEPKLSHEPENEPSHEQTHRHEEDPLDRIRQEFAEKQRRVIEEQRLRFEEHKKQLIAKAEEELKQRQQKIQQEMEEQERLILQQLEQQLKEQEKAEEQAIEEMRLQLEEELKEQERLEKQKMAFAQLREQHEREEAEELQAVREKYEQAKKEQLAALAEERAEWEKREQERLKRERQKFAEREAALIEELERQLAAEEQAIKERRAEQWKQLMEERDTQVLEVVEPSVEQQQPLVKEEAVVEPQEESQKEPQKSKEDREESKEEPKIEVEESVGQELAAPTTEQEKEEKTETPAEQSSEEEQKTKQTAQKRKKRRRRRRKKKKKPVETGEPLEVALQDDELAELKRLEEEQKRLEEMAQKAQDPVSEGTS
jgi:hypothetical protein